MDYLRSMLYKPISRKKHFFFVSEFFVFIVLTAYGRIVEIEISEFYKGPSNPGLEFFIRPKIILEPSYFLLTLLSVSKLGYHTRLNQKFMKPQNDWANFFGFSKKVNFDFHLTVAVPGKIFSDHKKCTVLILFCTPKNHYFAPNC